ncbi:MAG: hypothetical protein SGPRY_001714 [Prymnesium sp.]
MCKLQQLEDELHAKQVQSDMERREASERIKEQLAAKTELEEEKQKLEEKLKQVGAAALTSTRAHPMPRSVSYAGG